MTREQEIRDVFVRFGGQMSMRKLAGYLMECGVFTQPEIANMAIPALANIAREALKAPDERGLPFAGPQRPHKGEDGELNRDWAQLTFWDKDTAFYNIELRDKQLVADWRSNRALRNYCLERFGEAPDDPFAGFVPD